MATISFTTTFDLTATSPKFIFVDTSNYAGQGVATSNVNGCFTNIVSPSGATIYSNTDFSDANCDIKVSTSTTNQTTILLPLGNDNLPELGTYTIYYEVFDKNLSLTYTKTNSYDYEYISPVVVINETVDCISTIFSQVDTTNYVVNKVSPTSFSRTNTLFYPPGVKGGAPAPIVVTSDTLRTTVFYNGTQTSEINTNLTYVFTDGLIVVDSVFGVKERLIDCSYYCSIACGIESFTNKMEDSKNNPVKYQEMRSTFNQVMSYVALIRLLIECSGADSDDISGYLDTIKRLIGDCNCGCGGKDEDPYSRVTGWGTIIGADGRNGTNGLNGSSWFSGSGDPSGGTGVVNDWYLDVATGNIFKKTGTATWTFELNIKGAAGANSYTYIAYASDASGANFTNTFNPALGWIAIKTTTSPLSPPIQSDFTGLWANYIGTQAISNNQTGSTPAAPGATTTSSFPIPAGTLAVGKQIIIDLKCTFTGNSATPWDTGMSGDVHIGGTGIYGFNTQTGSNEYVIFSHAVVSVISNTTVNSQETFSTYDLNGNLLHTFNQLAVGLTINNITTSSNNIVASLTNSAGTGTAQINYLTVVIQ